MLYGVAADCQHRRCAGRQRRGHPLPLGDERGVPASAATATPFSQSMMAPLEAEGAVRSDWVDSRACGRHAVGMVAGPMPGSAIEESVSALATQALPLDDGQAASQASQPAVLTTLDFPTHAPARCQGGFKPWLHGVPSSRLMCWGWRWSLPNRRGR